MKYSQIIRISVGLTLSASILMGCASRESATDAPAAEPETAVSEPVTSTPQSETSSSETGQPNQPAADISTSETNRAEASEVSSGETTLNPPQAATLTANDLNSRINLRSQPTTASDREGYGLAGDTVKLLKAAEGEDDFTWYYVEFDDSGAEGWIRGDFIQTSGVAASANTATSTDSVGSDVSVDNFSTDEIFAVGSGGCGMTLWSTTTGDFIFFNGIAESDMWMKLDGEMTQFRRTDASGPEFYGQAGSQSFVSLDGRYEVDVTATAGSDKGYEAVHIDSGTLNLKAGGETTQFDVEGDAGC